VNWIILTLVIFLLIVCPILIGMSIGFGLGEQHNSRLDGGRE